MIYITKVNLHKRYLILLAFTAYSIALASQVQIYRLTTDLDIAKKRIEALQDELKLKTIRPTTLERRSLLWALKRQAEPIVETPEQVKAYITEKFGKDAAIALAVFTAESGLNCNAIGDKKLAFYKDGVKYGQSYGIAQIRYLKGRPSPEKLLDCKFNIDLSYKLSKQGTDFGAWSAYTNKSFMRHLAGQ